MIMNRIADVIFMLAPILILLQFKTTDYITVFTLIPVMYLEVMTVFGYPVYVISLCCFFIFIGGIGKSAQLGFHTWLPDAMEGPTPVSALLHAATMVTAGVFVVIRCSFIFEYCENILNILVLLGGITSIYAGLVAIFVFDIKKVIAYSTTSQLGYMFLTCGLSGYMLSFFHLFNHAFFKALLFLSAGVVIHALLNEQDMRRMGGLRIFLPFTFMCFIIGSLAIMGFPFLTGFYSKDLILELAYSRYIIDALFVYFLSLMSAICTAIYSLRLICLTFLTTSVINMPFRYIKELNLLKEEAS
jgi:NADH:ubiquinone oxidoreductase subunit 5 (subunit L)/multisubunit Na+/H+ antiporter MnhA subunit